jgi:exonuclease SbcC
MIPVKLTLRGLYSYKEEQTIDFEKLTAAGMFGIFGAVGSGKSSILEAILLALYGSTERLSDRGEKNSMVNLQSSHLLINFEFRAGKNNGQHFLARYSAKRNPKNFDEIKPAEHTFYLKEGTELVPVQEKAETIIGMKKEHFKQTVIIPQGKFREFIDLTPGPRAEMMKELFGLERFDLSAKTGGLKKTVLNELIRLETKLEGLNDTSEEILKEREKEQKELLITLENLENSFEKISLELRSQESIKAKHEKLQGYQADWKDLQTRSKDIEAKRKNLKAFMQANSQLRPIWNQIKDWDMEMEKAITGIDNCTRFEKAYTEEIEKLELQEAELRVKAEKRPLREGKIRDLEKILEIQIIEKDLKDAQDNLSLLQPSIDEDTKKKEALKKKLSSLESELDSSSSKNNNTQLATLSVNINDWKSFSEQTNILQAALEQINSDKKAIAEKRKKLLAFIPEAFENLESWESQENGKLKSTEAAKQQLIENKALHVHLKNLKEGEPCPLCGSEQHPLPLEADHTEEKLIALNKELDHSVQTLDEIQKLSRQLYDQNLQHSNQSKFFTDKEKELEQLNSRFLSLKKDLNEKGFQSLDDLEEAYQNISTQIEKEKALQNDLRGFRKQLEKLEEKIEMNQQQLRDAEQKIIARKSTLEAKEEEISDKEFSYRYLELTKETIQQTISSVKKDILETANLLDSKQKVLNDQRSKSATNLANLENFKKDKEEAAIRLEDLNKAYNGLKIKLGLTNQEQLEKLFTSELDEEKMDQEIRAYEKDCSVVQSYIADLEAEEGVINFDQSQFDLLQGGHEAKQAELENAKNKKINLARDITELKEKLDNRKALKKAKDLLENRASNLKELEQLFKGSGFVKYVSSIYLKELCNTANKRFTQLTKNSLRMEIDANNTFWVVDYLNEGKKRLLKTLSGGQTFQASLCLALALAEKVKSLNQADQSFFFLDEGFGALDRKSLRIVFETLKALRHENRIVGIISHVEELQQEIEVFANIVLDPEKGSQVHYSYQ